MNNVFWLAIVLLSLRLIWRLILKQSAYPELIPKKIKIIHATILFYVMLYGLSGFCSLLSVILHDHVLLMLENKSNGHLIDFAFLINGVAGTTLLYLCASIARREKNVLTKFLVCWLLTFSSSIYISIIRESGQFILPVIIIGMTISTIVFILTVVFYLIPATTIIWRE